MTQPGLGGGLVPHQVVADLQDIGNWKVWTPAHVISSRMHCIFAGVYVIGS